MMAEAQGLDLVVQRASPEQGTPTDDELLLWVKTALQHADQNEPQLSSELTIRLVDEAEGRELNARYRDKDSATNVLSFPADLPEQIRQEMQSESGSRALGDLVICIPVVHRESREQSKTVKDHWAHLVIHGVLHLLGHDHLEEHLAEDMESLEKHILASLGIEDPYLDHQ